MPDHSVRSGSQFRHYLEQLGKNTDPHVGFFGPESIYWRVSREPVLLLVGMRALLMQIAHPKVAQGVADHSRYREDPLGRGIRTFTAVYGIVFGSRAEAIEAAMAVHTVHGRVRGKVRDALPTGMDRHYDARDPELQLWVSATLIDSAIGAYELFVGPLSATEKEAYYQQGKVFGQLFGVPRALYPAHWPDFQHWLADMLASETLTVTPTARAIVEGLLSGTQFARLLAPVNYAVAAMLLPASLVDAFGLRRGRAIRAGYSLTVWLGRLLVRFCPRRLCGVPHARRSEKRLRREGLLGC